MVSAIVDCGGLYFQYEQWWLLSQLKIANWCASRDIARTETHELYFKPQQIYTEQLKKYRAATLSDVEYLSKFKVLFHL